MLKVFASVSEKLFKNDYMNFKKVVGEDFDHGDPPPFVSR